MAAGDPLEKLARVAQDHLDATKDITDSFINELNAAPVPPVIYHYTNDSGLRGILES